MLNLVDLEAEELEVDEVLADSVLEIGPSVPLRPVRRGFLYHRARRLVCWAAFSFLVSVRSRPFLFALSAAVVVVVGILVFGSVRYVRPSLVAW